MMNYYDEIKEKLLKNELFDRVKDYSKDRHKVNVYFEIGKLLHDAGKEYGKSIIKLYSKKLMIEVGSKYNERTLYSMRKFYEVFNNEKLNPLGSKLSWSHFRELLVVKDINAIKYYIYITERKNLNKRELHEIIKNREYDRLNDETKNKLVEFRQLQANDLIPNPILVKSSMLKKELSEYALKQLILNNLDEFLLQLGYGFTYVGNEFRIRVDNVYNYIDMLLFNIEYNCYVVIELKVTGLRKEHIGQIQVYMNYIDKNLKKNKSR